MGAMNRGPDVGNMDDNYRIIDRLDLGFSKIGEFQSVPLDWRIRNASWT